MVISLKPLANQVIVITGASSGIGLVTARMAAKRAGWFHTTREKNKPSF
ncbi:MAG: hypothetical protein KAF91_08710 [Nostoc sp. TH1S01]|nr:hypothetical protein [Nostoc sp. TH1S01]